MTQSNEAIRLIAVILRWHDLFVVYIVELEFLSKHFLRSNQVCKAQLLCQSFPFYQATNLQQRSCKLAMAPTTPLHGLEDPETSLASMNPPSSLDAGEDMIPLQPSTAENVSANDDASSDSSPSPSRKSTTSRSRAKKARKAAHHNQNSKPSLRPAKDILSRIRHDPSLDESGFILL